ncbi:trafficking protein particle complex subunit 5 isoform X1 [Leguminivora glycinivorella]|uniref:trafficking protein particle complex subunit 5 isoform X1 n=1 Tax=Leguminivora glycinivorella TaxID=1035111 RepID=UPI0020103F48|nr:trafficking protein particle complex subunit 5 isoform X1 [Leguminivora glycinivorella]
MKNSFGHANIQFYGHHSAVRGPGRHHALYCCSSYPPVQREGLMTYMHTSVIFISMLSEIGQDVGARLLDLYFVRERGGKREIKLLNMLLFVKSTLWKVLFGKEADKLEHANDDERTYYIIEKDALVNKFISVPKDKGSLNCATFNAGIIEAVLTRSGFPAKVTAHWHKGTTYMVKFEDSVITRDKSLDDR